MRHADKSLRTPFSTVRVGRGLLEADQVAVNRTFARLVPRLSFGGFRLEPSPKLGMTVGERQGIAVTMSAGRYVLPDVLESFHGKISVLDRFGMFVHEYVRARRGGTLDI